MEITGCPYCENGCRMCGFTGMAPVPHDELQAARESGITFTEVDLTAHLPGVSLTETKRAIAKIKARERGIRVATVDGEHVPDINRKNRR